MSKPAPRAMNVDEFFAWQERQDGRYELVNGRPLQMMAGAWKVHDRIVINIIFALESRLRDGPCVPFTGDNAVETYPGQIRRPDVGVDCGKQDPEAFKADAPRVVFEVLSPSTRDFDSVEKLAEYQAIEALDYIVYVEPNRPEVRLWSRGEGRVWVASTERDLSATIDLPSLGISLPVAEIYARVAFPSGPMSRVE